MRIKSFWVCPSRKWPVRQIRHCQFCNQEISKNQNYFYSGGFLPFNMNLLKPRPQTPLFPKALIMFSAVLFSKSCIMSSKVYRLTSNLSLKKLRLSQLFKEKNWSEDKNPPRNSILFILIWMFCKGEPVAASLHSKG